MKATLKADGYIELESENEEERAALNVIADEGIDLAHISWSRGSTTVTVRRTYFANLQANAAEDFRQEMIGQAISIKEELENLQDRLAGLWGHEADHTEPKAKRMAQEAG